MTTHVSLNIFESEVGLFLLSFVKKMFNFRESCDDKVKVILGSALCLMALKTYGSLCWGRTWVHMFLLGVKLEAVGMTTCFGLIF